MYVGALRRKNIFLNNNLSYTYPDIQQRILDVNNVIYLEDNPVHEKPNHDSTYLLEDMEILHLMGNDMPKALKKTINYAYLELQNINSFSFLKLLKQIFKHILRYALFQRPLFGKGALFWLFNNIFSRLCVYFFFINKNS